MTFFVLLHRELLLGQWHAGWNQITKKQQHLSASKVSYSAARLGVCSPSDQVSSQTVQTQRTQPTQSCFCHTDVLDNIPDGLSISWRDLPVKVNGMISSQLHRKIKHKAHVASSVHEAHFFVRVTEGAEVSLIMLGEIKRLEGGCGGSHWVYPLSLGRLLASDSASWWEHQPKSGLPPYLLLTIPPPHTEKPLRHHTHTQLLPKYCSGSIVERARQANTMLYSLKSLGNIIL